MLTTAHLAISSLWANHPPGFRLRIGQKALEHTHAVGVTRDAVVQRDHHHSAPERLGVRPKRKFALRTSDLDALRRDQLALSAVPGLIGKTATGRGRSVAERMSIISEGADSCPSRDDPSSLSAQLRHTMRDLQWPVNVDSDHIFVSGSKALSAGPARPAEILPGTTIHIALRIQGLRTRVFRRIELEHHPLWVRNAGVRGLVQ
jgi:hypothetical protein